MLNKRPMELTTDGKPIHTIVRNAIQKGKFLVTGTLKYKMLIEQLEERGYNVTNVKFMSGNKFKGFVTKRS